MNIALFYMMCLQRLENRLTEILEKNTIHGEFATHMHLTLN